MDVNIVSKAGKTYIEILGPQSVIRHEQDVIDLMGQCFDSNTNLFMIHPENLTEDFFNLKTRNAGLILQKFVNYQCKVVLVMPPDMIKHKRFQEMISEANRGNHFHIFGDKSEAEDWLLSD